MSADSLAALALGAASGALGIAFGLIYFRALHRTVEGFVGGTSPSRVAVFSLARLAVAAVALFLLARLGAVVLLSGFLGFLLARTIALRATRSQH